MKLKSIIVATLLIALTAFAEDYPGPAGLTWDMSRQQVKEILSKKFGFDNAGFNDAGAWDMRFRGNFAGFETESISVEFANDSLLALAVMIKTASLYPISRQYNDIKKIMREKYGEPDVAELPKKIPLLGKVMDEFEYYDSQIRSGEWNPHSIWIFDNDVKIIVAISLGEINDFGMHNLELIWCFFKIGRCERFWKEYEKSEVPDF